MSFITRRAPLLVFVVLFFSRGLLVSEGGRHARERKYYPEEPPIKTIVLDNGDVIDCVNFYSQPAMKHHFVRRNPQVRAKFPPQQAITAEDKSQAQRNGTLQGIGWKSTGCPLGSVPFLKATKAGRLNLSAIHDFKKSTAKLFQLGSKSIKIEEDNPEDHEYAIMRVKDGKYTGAEGSFNIWQPIVESRSEISLSQIWVVRVIGDNLASLEAGWTVHPVLFGDYQTRFFILTTNDTYKSTLYGDDKRDPRENNDLQFVREPDVHLPLGSALSSSVYEGDQKELQIRIQMNHHGNWDLFVDGEKIGFWPRENYGDGFPLANDVEWGGEVVNMRSKKRHTSTQMGSGEFSKAGIGRAAYIRNLGLYDQDGKYYDTPQNPSLYTDKAGCYDVTYWERDERFGSHITMGGPGYDEQTCPH